MSGSSFVALYDLIVGVLRLRGRVGADKVVVASVLTWAHMERAGGFPRCPNMTAAIFTVFSGLCKTEAMVDIVLNFDYVQWGLNGKEFRLPVQVNILGNVTLELECREKQKPFGEHMVNEKLEAHGELLCV